MATRKEDQKPAPAAPYLELGDRLRQRARALGLRDAEVARRLEITPQRYSHYVNGIRKPSPEMLSKIGAVLSITADELIAPSWPLLHTDREQRLETRKLAEYCARLTPDQIDVLANLALFLSSERRNEEDAPLGVPPRMHAIARVHERVIPSLIRTLDPLGIATHSEFAARNGIQETYIVLTIDFPIEKSSREIEGALYDLVAERLRDIRMQIESIEPEKVETCHRMNVVLKYTSASDRDSPTGTSRRPGARPTGSSPKARHPSRFI